LLILFLVIIIILEVNNKNLGSVELSGVQISCWVSAILSEGMHSGLNFVAASMTLYAVRMAMKTPDPEHNYGHAI
jgi:divalent metal cation (Fe/Co/Zn/Cd) transporter